VQLILDGRRSNTAQILLGKSSRIVDSFDEERLDSLGGTAPARLVTRTWFNASLEPLRSAVPALFAVLFAVVGLMVSSLSIAREHELGTFEQLLGAPLKPFEILTGKSVPALLIALTSATAILVLELMFLSVPFRGSLTLLFLGMVVYLGPIIGKGLFISTLAKTQQQAIIGFFMYMVPAVLDSDCATPSKTCPTGCNGWPQRPQSRTLSSSVRRSICVTPRWRSTLRISGPWR